MPLKPVTLLDEAQCLELEAELAASLYAFNREATGYADGKLIGGCVRDAAAALIAGFSGHTWGGACVITHLWIAPEYRQQGLGRVLMHQAETEALRCRCTQLIVMTHSFQAPQFYERLGYTCVSAVSDWPRGHENIVYRKHLEAAAHP